jgi:hypothetical protein
MRGRVSARAVITLLQGNDCTITGGRKQGSRTDSPLRPWLGACLQPIRTTGRGSSRLPMRIRLTRQPDGGEGRNLRGSCDHNANSLVDAWLARAQASSLARWRAVHRLSARNHCILVKRRVQSGSVEGYWEPTVTRSSTTVSASRPSKGRRSPVCTRYMPTCSAYSPAGRDRGSIRP